MTKVTPPLLHQLIEWDEPDSVVPDVDVLPTFSAGVTLVNFDKQPFQLRHSLLVSFQLLFSSGLQAHLLSHPDIKCPLCRRIEPATSWV